MGFHTFLLKQTRDNDTFKAINEQTDHMCTLKLCIQNLRGNFWGANVRELQVLAHFHFSSNKDQTHWGRYVSTVITLAVSQELLGCLVWLVVYVGLNSCVALSSIKLFYKAISQGGSTSHFAVRGKMRMWRPAPLWTCFSHPALRMKRWQQCWLPVRSHEILSALEISPVLLQLLWRRWGGQGTAW